MKQEHETVEVPTVPDEQMKMPASTTVVEAPKTPLSMLMIIILIVVLLIILAGLYAWSTTMTSDVPTIETVTERPSVEANDEPESTTAEAMVDTLEVVSTSDELAAIEADLEATIIADLEADFADIETELFSNVE